MVEAERVWEKGGRARKSEKERTVTSVKGRGGICRVSRQEELRSPFPFAAYSGLG